MGKASVKIHISTHIKELTQEGSPLHVMNVGKKFSQISHLIKHWRTHLLHMQVSVNAQDFDTRIATNEEKLIQCS